jgi:hypothetical protein
MKAMLHPRRPPLSDRGELASQFRVNLETERIPKLVLHQPDQKRLPELS